MVPWHVVIRPVFFGGFAVIWTLPWICSRKLAAKPLNIFESCLTNPKQNRQWSRLDGWINVNHNVWNHNHQIGINKNRASTGIDNVFPSPKKDENNTTSNRRYFHIYIVLEFFSHFWVEFKDECWKLNPMKFHRFVHWDPCLGHFSSSRLFQLAWWDWDAPYSTTSFCKLGSCKWFSRLVYS